MNKIYKVIWSKVKNQYVVVSELAHSSGKQSRTSRSSIRSRIAALVVCGAIAAFGVFSALPNSAYAEVAGGEANQSQYIAIAIEGKPGEKNNDATWHNGRWPWNEGYWELNDEKVYGGYTYVRQTVTLEDGSEKEYWVRKGYDITATQGERHESINDDTDYIIDAKKNAQYDASSDKGLLQAYQTTTSEGKITTLTGVNIEKLDTGVYGGASNTSGVTTPSTFGYHIKVGGVGAASDGYIRVTGDPESSNPNFSTYFSYDINLENNGSYSYVNSNGEKVIVPNNKIYSIDGKLGVFTDAKGNLYTGDVYGDNNEILLSGSDGNKIYSYWGTKINDLSQTIGNMTVQEYNYDRKKLQDQAAAYHGDDITNIAVGGANNKGTISLNRVGIYDEQTGDYTSTTPVPGTITITSEGGTGSKDVAIKFANDQGSFTVDAGSKVVANNGAGGTDLESISVNGQTFNVVGGAIAGQIDSEGNVKIQQGNKAPVTIGKVSDWNVKSGQINGSTLTLNTENAYDGNPKTGTVTIKGVASTNYVDVKDALNVKYDNTEKKSVTLGNSGTPVKLTNVVDGSTKYDAVNFGQLQTVANAEDYVTGGSIDNNSGTITLNRQLGGSVEITGLKTYLTANDDYATGATLNGSKLTVQRHLGGSFDVDLSGLTSGLSSSDYQLVADPSGEYKVSADGKLTLKVQDMNNPEAQPEDVAISGIAQKDYVDGQFTTINTNLTEMNTTIDSHDQKLKHIEHHDGVFGTDFDDYTTVEGTEFYNDGSISSKVDSILQDATNSFDFNDNGGSFVTKKESRIGVPFVGGTKTTTTDKAEFNDGGATFTNTTKTEEYKLGHLFPDVTETTSSTNIKGGTITLTSSAREDGTPIEINGTTGDVTGLSNTEWDATKTYSDGRAATEEQLQKATSTLTTNERHIATNGGDNPEAPNNKYTVQADGKVSLTEVNGDGTPTKNTVVLDNVATKTQQDINTDKLTHIEHYAVDDEGNTEGKDYTQVEGTKLYNDGSISSTVKDGLGMSSDTLTFDESGLTVSKETMGNSSGSTNISGDAIKTVDEYGNETTIDGGSVTTEDLTVNTENGNKLTFDSTGLNVNSGDTGLSVNKDGISLSVDNGAGKNSSVKVTQDGTEFSYSENGIADATTTTIKGSTITTDTVTGLNNTKWDDVTKQSVADDTDRTGAASMAATQGQLADAIKQAGDSAAANDYRLVQNGTTDDGKEVPYEINGNDQVELKVANSLGDDYTVTIDDVAKASELDTLTSQVDSGWTAKDSEGNVVEVNKENGHILNFYGDENINVTADKGAINIGLNPIVTLGDKNGSYIQLNSQPTDDDAMLTIVGPKDPVTGTHGEFAVGQDGTVHSTGDVIAYENGEDYSLGEIGDTVRHMMHVDTGEYAGNSHHYTVIGYNNEQDPIGGGFSLAVREDGAVAVGGKDGIKLNETPGTITGLQNTEWSAETGADDTTAKTAATQGQLNDLYNAVVSYDIGSNYGTVTLKGADYNSDTHKGGTRITNVAYSDGIGSDAVNVDYLNNAIETATTGEGGVIAENEKHLATNAGVNPDNKDNYYKPDEDGNITINEVNGNGVETGNSVVINDVASKEQLDKVSDQVDKNTTNIGDMDFSDTNYIKGDTNLTDAVVDLDGAIKDTNDRIDGLGDKIDEVSNSSITGGKINEDTGKIDLIKNDGTAVTMEGQLSDSILDTVDDSKLKSDGEIILTSHDKYDPNKTESVTLNDIASKTNLDNLSSTVGATTTEELKESYKDTAYINDADTMVDADVKLDQAVQNVASTSYANDMYLNERINNVESRLGDVEERIDKVGAMAAAIANLRTMGYDPEAPTEIAVGVGQYKSETGIAIGVFHYPNQDFMLSASLSSSGDELMGGIGATWKLGRKSAAEKAKDEEARRLEKAEEMKKLAQDAKVKAQAERHAKLLAEREAQKTA